MQPLDSHYLSTALSPYRVTVKEIIDSTNQYLLDRITELNKGDICLAEQQTAGRGRRGRAWQSPFGSQIIMSFYWTLEQKKTLEGLSLVIGIAIAESLRQAGATGIGLKWPNDVLLNGRKLAGILVEIANEQNELNNLVVGIGINLSLPPAENISQPWANLNEVLPDIDRNRLIVQLIRNLYEHLALFEQLGIQAFRQKWLEWDYYLEKKVNIIAEQNVISGKAQGIDEQGYLLIETANGLLRFNGGEVSLRSS